MHKRLFLAAGLALGLSVGLSGLSGAAIAQTAAPADAPVLEITVAGEGVGVIRVTLRPDLAPEHVERVVTLAEQGAYDGVVFHRVIEGFMAQTGDVQFGRGGGDTARAGMGGSELTCGPNSPRSPLRAA